MTAKREALLARFRARSLERLGKVIRALIDHEDGRGDADSLQQLARELHTLKGDSRVVGYGRLSEVVHRVEAALPGASASGSALFVSLRVALEGVGRVLKDELEGEAAEAVLAEAVSALPELAAGVPSSPQPAPAAPAAAASAPAPAAGPADRFRLVSNARIEDTCDRVLDFSAEFRALALQVRAIGSTGSALSDQFERCLTKLEDVVSAAWTLRMVPVTPALEELVGHAHELAASLGKRVNVVIDGGGAEVERAIVDDLEEPLLHLVRNAIDHGLEAPGERGRKPAEGTLTLRALVAGPSLLLEVADDGRGVDLAAVRKKAHEKGLLSGEDSASLDERRTLELLFRHGFSTREVAGEVSGRGVGLDVVRDRLDEVGGTVSVSTVPGQGTTFSLRLPTALSRERALVVECGGRLFGVPAVNVLEVVRLADARVEPVAGGIALRHRDEVLPMVPLLALLGEVSRGEAWALVLQGTGKRLAVSIGQPVGQQDLLRRPVDALLASFPALSGSATLDDGRLVLLLSVASLLKREQGVKATGDTAGATQRQHVLVVDDSLTVSNLVNELLTEAGFSVTEAHDGAQALEAMRARQPQLVVADVDMPVMNGFELLEAIRESWPELPVIMLTMRGSADDRRRAASLGANAYLVKSQFDEHTLADTVRRLIGGAA